MKNYSSVVYDLTQFGIYKISNAIVTADMDDGITIEVSFDGGSSFIPVRTMNKKFYVEKSRGKIQVKITFDDIKKTDIYKVKATGFFQNLDIGTTINFTRKFTNENYKTTLGENGRYTIFLPRGMYSVWKQTNGNKVQLIDNLNPEIIQSSTGGLDKENTIEMFLRGVEWAKYSVFDTFTDHTKMLNGNAIIDSYGLSDGITNRRVRYWAIGFE